MLSIKFINTIQLSLIVMVSIIGQGCSNSDKNSGSEKEIELLKKEIELQKKEQELKDKENVSSTPTENKTNRSQTTNNREERGAFYIINVSAIKSEEDAKKKVRELQSQGYNSDYLWIPDYASLSGSLYYSVYIGPYYSQYDCEVATEDYKRVNPKAYGLKVSQENQRVQIDGIGKVTTSKAKK
jgi:hypothetical protein